MKHQKKKNAAKGKGRGKRAARFATVKLVAATAGAVILIIALMFFLDKPSPPAPMKRPEVKVAEPRIAPEPIELSPFEEELIGKLDAFIDDPADEHLRLFSTWGETLKMIHKGVAVLKTESTSDSLANLHDVGMFLVEGSRLGPQSTIVQFPPEPYVGSKVLEQVLSNRRMMKLMHELSDLSRSEASRLVSDQIRENLKRYDDFYQREVRDNLSRDPDPDGDGMLAGFTYQISTKNGEPTLMGLRYSLLGLVMIAGSLELEGAQAATLEVADYALQQRDALYRMKDEGGSSIIASDALLRGSLYIRQALAIGILGTSEDPRVGKQILDDDLPTDIDSGKAWIQHQLPRFDALTTPFESPSTAIPAGNPGYIPPDYSGGSRLVVSPLFVSDAAINQLSKHLR